jgi:hypothetical protein
MEHDQRAGAGKPALVEQHVQRERGEVVGEGLQLRVPFLVEDLEIGPALVAGLGPPGGVAAAALALGAEVLQAFVLCAIAARDPGEVPLATAQSADEVAPAGALGADPDDAGDGTAGADRAQRRHVATIDVPDSERRRVAQIVRTTSELGQRANADIKALIWLYENGRGTLGGFNRDIQIFDELKEMHRILKRESWRVIIKRKPR